MNKKNRNLKVDENNRYQEMRKRRDPRLVNYSGIHGTLKPEIVPVYDKKMDETLIQGTTNATIVLGRDRPRGIASGYSNKDISCAAIDIVAGRVSSEPVAKILERDVSVSNNFEQDASRIYLSEMTDLDENLGIPEYKIPLLNGNSTFADDYAKGSSGIAVISDCVRVVGRKNIKLVTKHISGDDDEMLGGISIIAGYDVPTNLHPMVRGNNLVEFCKSTQNCIRDLYQLLLDVVNLQTKINIDFATHKHMLDFKNNITDSKILRETTMAESQLLLEKTQNSLLTLNTKITKELIEYLTPTNDKYINSKYNKVN